MYSCNPTPGHIYGENSNSKRCIHQPRHGRKQPESTDRWINKEDRAHVYNGIATQP